MVRWLWASAAGIQAALVLLMILLTGGEALAHKVLVPRVVLASSGVQVAEMVCLASRPVSPEEFESDDRLTVRHEGREPLTDVRLNLLAAGRGVAVLAGTMPVARIVPGQTVWPGAAVRLRHARTQEIAASDLVWRTDVASGDECYLRLIEAEIAHEATVAQVNAALHAAGASLWRSRPGDPRVTLLLDTKPDLSALVARAAGLDRTGAFAWALPMPRMRPEDLSEGAVPRDVAADRGAVRHHAAVLPPVAWGLADMAASSDVVLIVVDNFGKGNVGDFGAPVQGIGSGSDCGRDCENGYHALGIAAASFGGTSDAFGKVTGATANAPVAL